MRLFPIISMTLTLILCLATSYLAVTMPLNGLDTGALSDNFDSMITPAGVAFSIWSLIYLSLTFFVLFCGYNVLKRNLGGERVTSKVWLVASANLALNGLWLVVWHYQYVLLSVIVMLMLLVSLIDIFIKLKEESWFYRLPWTIYFGWISVATIINISTLFIDLGWDQLMGGDLVWTIIMTFIAFVIGVIMVFRENVYSFSGVLIWAFYFIAVENRKVESFYYYLLILCISLGISIIVKYLRNKSIT